MKSVFYIFLCSIAIIAAAATPERVAVRHVAELAAKGDPKGLYDLAVLHDIGYDSIAVDSARSTALYRLSAQSGYAPAQNYLGFRYFNGEGVRENVDSALFWLAKAAGQGDAKAANNLGFLLANSDRVTRDYPQAMRWLGKAADAGVATAESLLADLYRQGLGTAPDTVAAEALYNKAILHGLRDAELKLLAMKGHAWERLPTDSALSLGQYHYSHGAPLIAVTLFETAAKGNVGTCLWHVAEPTEAHAKALALLGDAYSRGVGVAYDHDKSVDYYLQAARLGDPSAQFVIAELLDIFPDALTELPPEEQTAAYWYERAAAQGVGDAETATLRLLNQ